MKTPQLPAPKLQQALGLANEVWLKREDLHHLGSHKGRSIPPMIDHYRKSGHRSFVISSSGNAALAAAKTIVAHNRNKPADRITLTIFIGKKIPSAKLKIIKEAAENDQHITLKQTENPKQEAFRAAKEADVINLRQSTDDTALSGYHELAKELVRIPNLAAVFVPTSSGTTAEGLFEGFTALALPALPEIHCVQTTACHPFADARLPSSTESSLADAIVDVVAHRKPAVREIIAQSGGAVWIADNNTIRSAMEITEKNTNITVSPNGALSVAGLMLATESGKTWNGPVVCLITGR